MNQDQFVVAYYRVSTARQGQSGLGLDAQKMAVAEFARKIGAKVVGTYQEVESGRKADRPELERAIAHAKRADARLVVAKLDRLSRDASFTASLQQSRVKFVACDMPDASDLTIGIMALIAQQEAKAIRERTKAALAAAKARGIRLGNPRLTDEQRRLGASKAAVVARQSADRDYKYLAPLMREMRREGKTLRQIAAALNADGKVTRRGKAWNAGQVKRVLERNGATPLP